jgi:ElaA protein
VTPRIRRAADLAACHAIRRAVFMDEQGIPEHLEFEGDDAGWEHWLAEAGGRPLATLRARLDGGTATLGRIAALPEARGSGLAAEMMRHVLADLAARGAREARLGAQERAMGFYRRLGFAPEGAAYDDAGIPHRWMRLALEARSGA